MKKLGIAGLVAFYLCVFPMVNLWALAITDVGGIDSFIASADLGNSGDATEEAWVESILGYDVDYMTSYDSFGSDWTLLDGESDVYAAELSGSPSHFLIKIGTGGTDLLSHYLFENNEDFTWAVVDFSDAGIDFAENNISISRISHVGEFGDLIEVTEPSSIALIILGTIGLMIQRRRFAVSKVR
ncbi:hypothetical protein [Teredinibacter sp. KSP-S5-2]|uniref:hypothetical protein n=1 Tax=Teredinibacter sp. KSP-S5-2 TaxID=3034506 RepID=UPI002934E178|nr:hypothetical protein [Teredinibacter sp. KSP-S5-2]WNO09878.1 hypothetical protein P5V12_01660 [Teredinibacter sp. KSP-S5-2]